MICRKLGLKTVHCELEIYKKTPMQC
jgi:hypothetical protein